ncbi:MAG: polyamine ABC transporter ATP-binding protein [Alphaproteobacteria bacterium 16-39-46]|nr:MAG: polyamine ABC transporter ATP-binding protein [Alphaproteobacteria bacterium 16-39-46]OZA41585.1 MAG: polyamine ABC transporter ATP-binding protein [Alphaproteobacteria bacterium 17-39-52]HQS84778.1 polyamine ABC transporter ATP-binding protein [Alphaproteobacteria bacterium]HQS94269.1 polyamine ABC transporter ATP-binding protein [Alphaproteobacteria bacterium]
MASKSPKRSYKFDPWLDPKNRPYIRIENVSKEFDGTMAVNNLSLSIYQGEFFSILGGSGCGKTTLLRMLAGFETPTSGKIYIDDIDMTTTPPYERPVNMMFQSYALFPHMSVGQNVAFGLKQEKLPKAEIKERVEGVLDLVQMSAFINRMPHQLSGGQRQRVALARSLVKQPKLLLLDEPLASLDKKLKERTQLELVTIQERVGITFIMVSHDQEESMTMSTRIAVMNEGQIKQVGPPHEIYEFPNSRFVADFIGSINMFEGIILEDASDHVIIQSDSMPSELCISHSATIPPGASVTVGVRPEKVKISKMSHGKPDVSYNYTSGIVDDIEYLGDVSIYHVLTANGRRILATLPNLVRLTEQPVTWEDKVYLYWQPENGIVLTV